jgi:hypothetical protein
LILFVVREIRKLKAKPNDTSVPQLIQRHANENSIDGSLSESIPGIIPNTPTPTAKSKIVKLKQKAIVKTKVKPSVSESIPGLVPNTPTPKAKVKAKAIVKLKPKPIVKVKTKLNVITGKQTKNAPTKMNCV